MRRIQILVLTALLLAAGCGGDDDDEAASDTVASDAVVAEEIDDLGAQDIRAVPLPDWVQVDGDSVWVAGADYGVARFDADSGEQVGSVDVGGICLAMDQGFDSLWLGDCDNQVVVRIDLESGEQVATIPIPEGIPPESSVAAGEGAVWLLTAEAQPRLLRIDPATNEVTDRFAAPGGTSVRAGEGSLWITRAESDEVARIDPATGEELAVVPVGDHPRFLVVDPDDHAVWVLGADSADVTRIDTGTDEAVATIAVGGDSVDGGDIALGRGHVWVRQTDTLVTEIDPATNEVVRVFEAPDAESVGSGGVGASDGALWITAHDIPILWRVPLD